MAGRKKYKSEDGMFLAVSNALNEGYYISWMDAEDGEGAALGEFAEPLATEPPADSDMWEIWVAQSAVKPLANSVTRSGTFIFETESKAKKALAMANEALLSGNKPWPEWAVLAKAAGWTPPKGWKV